MSSTEIETAASLMKNSDTTIENPTCINNNNDQPEDIPHLFLWELPESLLFYIVSFVAPPTHRAAVLCHQIAPLCRAAYHKILEESTSSSSSLETEGVASQDESAGFSTSSLLWDAVLQEDYGVHEEEATQLQNTNHHRSKRRCSSRITQLQERPRRACKRLRRSPVHRVRDAHLLIKDHTEIAFYYLTEMTNSSKQKLSKTSLVRLLEEYGPHLRINMIVSSGGLYLVEVCRARHVKEQVILKCVKELIEERGALVNLATQESESSRQTALCVAAVRAMPTVVQYLLQHGADPSVLSSGRFRLHTQPKKTLHCRSVTPLAFAQAMHQAERDVGASEQDLRCLKKCIRLLESQA